VLLNCTNDVNQFGKRSFLSEVESLVDNTTNNYFMCKDIHKKAKVGTFFFYKSREPAN